MNSTLSRPKHGATTLIASSCGSTASAAAPTLYIGRPVNYNGCALHGRPSQSVRDVTIHGRAYEDRQRNEPIASGPSRDRKSTRLNSSHVKISYAVFCLKK